MTWVNEAWNQLPDRITHMVRLKSANSNVQSGKSLETFLAEILGHFQNENKVFLSMHMKLNRTPWGPPGYKKLFLFGFLLAG